MPDETVAEVDQSQQQKKPRRRWRKGKLKESSHNTERERAHVNSGLTKQSNSGVTKQSNSGVTKQGNSGVTIQGNSGVTKQGNSGVIKQGKSDPSRSKKKRRADRYYGRFCCPACRRSWESALVFTCAGTKKVLFKQRCKNCDCQEAWVFPYRLELLRCSQCQSQVCDCLCEDCDKLKHRRYKDDKKEIVDDSFEYCMCDKRSKVPVGVHIKAQKPHLSNLCQKCLAGSPCRTALAELE